MSDSKSVESGDDLADTPLVRLEDVQPRSRSLDMDALKAEAIDSFLVDNVDFDHECVVTENEDDSNVGSMVSVQSEEVITCDENSDLMLPEVMDPDGDPIDIADEKAKCDAKVISESWPTLEILPGGVIKHGEKIEEESSLSNQPEQATEPNTKVESSEMMYACAKCSQSFKHLFCLVKHVKWHEEESKKMKKPDLTKLSELEKDLVCVKQERLDMEMSYKRQKIDVYERIGKAMEKMQNWDSFF